MAREVNNQQPFQDKVVKLIPTEIVGAYLVILGIVAPADPTADLYSKYALIGAFFVLLVLTPLYLWKVSGVTNGIQLIVSTLSFVVWSYTLIYPFAYWKVYNATIGAVVLVLWSLVTPFFVTANPPAVEDEEPAPPEAVNLNQPVSDPAPQPPA